ncbi:N-alpha-acetyltransferase 25, NatB auxiliary subunit [Halotydeus destructor]|nr:N-alpha-acetyltransferase 25, NatB auxiliary subunit [Halotydeus destructor]
MANKVDSAVTERRLRPIYDFLDNGSNKQAAAEADKVLKKQKDCQCARVLKALALIRLGRQSESLVLLDEVHRQAPTDDSTLQAMTICYRDLQRVDLLVNAYEQAAAKEPNNEELLSHLFMAYVRINDYKKQQQTATSLFKIKPKNPYYFWSVMSLYMQAITEEDQKMAQLIFLPLAEKKVKKYIDENKIDAEAEVELYLMILEKQKKYEAMLEVIDGPLVRLMKNYLNFLTRRKAKLLFELKRYKEAMDVYKVLVEHSPDQLEYYQDIYKMAFVESGDENFVKQAIDITKHYANQCLKQGSHKLRGPFLGKMILFNMLSGSGSLKTESLLENIAEDRKQMLTEYFELFGNKMAFYFDLCFVVRESEEYLQEVPQVISFAEETVDLKSLPDSIDNLYRHLNYSLMQFFLYDVPKSPEKRLEMVLDFSRRYEDSIKFGEKNMPSEIQPADYYCLLISHLLSYEASNDDGKVIALLVLLEKALLKSPSNHHLKLLSVNLYNRIGAVSCSLTKYESLEIKHLQQESLGYLMFNPLLSLARFSTASQVLSNALRFYTATYKDTYEYLISCYKFGSFTKVEEIMEVRKRLQKSVQFSAITMERMILSLILNGESSTAVKEALDEFDIQVEDDVIDTDSLHDNRDLSIFFAFGKRSQDELENWKRRTLQSDKLSVRFRNLWLRTIAFVYSGSVAPRNFENGNSQNGKEVKPMLQQYIAELKKCVADIRSSDIALDSSTCSITGPPLPRLLSWRQSNHAEVIISLFELLDGLTDGAVQEAIAVDKVKTITELLKQLLEYISKRTIKSYVDARTVIEEFGNLMDTVNLASVILCLIHWELKAKIKKNSKKVQTPSGDNLTNGFSILLEGFEKLIKDTEVQMKQYDFSKITVTTLAFDLPADSQLSFQETDGTRTKVMENIQKSYHQSIKELNHVSDVKLKLIASLRK